MIPVPYPVTVWIIRADKYKGTQNEISAANAFRASLKLASLAAYEQDPNTEPRC